MIIDRRILAVILAFVLAFVAVCSLWFTFLFILPPNSYSGDLQGCCVLSLVVWIAVFLLALRGLLKKVEKVEAEKQANKD
jgi:hypothetical protein